MPLYDATRKRHEHQIKMLDHYVGGTTAFDNALAWAVSRHRGLSWFTDEQIAEIRAEMIKRDWFRHNLNRQHRKRRAA